MSVWSRPGAVCALPPQLVYRGNDSFEAVFLDFSHRIKVRVTVSLTVRAVKEKHLNTVKCNNPKSISIVWYLCKVYFYGTSEGYGGDPTC